MLVTLEKLAFYYFQPNPDLFYYYAATDTLTFRGVATPELAEALYDHLEVGEPFKCKIIERDDHSFKLVELLDPAKTKPSSPPPQVRGCGALLPGTRNVSFTPTQITAYKRGQDNVWATIKSKAGDKFTGRVEKCWFMWYLTMMRKQTETKITIRPFPKVFDAFLNRKSVSREAFVERQESTYLDNKDRFFFANDSPTLRQSDYLKNKIFATE